ncbi:chymotrypsin inhibitor-like isoform 1 [Aphelenchoides avenae]|nr:chymotrypsin inhibitor-like isoform 1 [Aphelenchus avenae]
MSQLTLVVPLALLHTTSVLWVAGDQSMPFRCMENESPKMCGSCEATCDHPYVPLCLDECRPGQCQCNAGYVRNGDGKCVPESVCEKGAKQGAAGEDRRFVLEMLKRQKMISSVNNPIVKRDTEQLEHQLLENREVPHNRRRVFQWPEHRMRMRRAGGETANGMSANAKPIKDDVGPAKPSADDPKYLAKLETLSEADRYKEHAEMPEKEE